METANNKIFGLKELSEILRELKSRGNKIVLCHGVFDLVHPGHIKHFMSASKEGDVLVVTLTQDKFVNKGPGRPVFNQHLRAESIAALQCVDFVAVNEWPTAEEAILSLKPDLYAKGAEYAAPEMDITGGISSEKQAIESIGGKILFTDEVTFSSSSLLNRYFSSFDDDTKIFLRDFARDHSAENVIGALQSLAPLKVLVIGDSIIDEYHYCKALGKSPKENIISTRYISEERFAGGVLACANHIAGFCDDVHLVTVLGGDDSKEDFIREHLKGNVESKFFYRSNTGTIIKRRFVDPDFLTKSFEISYLEDRPVSPKLSEDICEHLGSCIEDYDLVIVSDFGHGLIGASMIDLLCTKAKFLAVNTQTNSANAGYNLITRYKKADYVCIDEPEIRLAIGDRYGKLEQIILKVAGLLSCDKVTVTRGHLGAKTYDKDKGFFDVPVFTDKIVDRIGAGDAFLSVTSPLVAAGNSMELTGFTGNAVGAIAVNIVGNRHSVDPVPLYKYITSLLK